MFGGLFGTVIGKILAVVVTVGGITGGMAATGALPVLTGIDVAPGPGPGGPVAVALPGAGVPLAFPDLPTIHQAIIDQGAQELAAGASTQAIQVAGRAETTAKKAAAAAQKCLDELTAQVNALVAGIPNITSAEQAGAMVEQARSIGADATECAKQATVLGQSGVDEITRAAGQLNFAVAQINSLNLQNTAGQVVQGAQDTLGAATKTIDQNKGNVFGMFGQISDMAATLMATAMEYQQKFQGDPSPVATSPVPTLPAPTAPAPANPFGGFGAWMDFATQMAQTYGTSFEFGSADTGGETSFDGFSRRTRR